jgi:hypothetical protein
VARRDRAARVRVGEGILTRSASPSEVDGEHHAHERSGRRGAWSGEWLRMTTDRVKLLELLGRLVLQQRPPCFASRRESLTIHQTSHSLHVVGHANEADRNLDSDWA